jgi:DNA-binding CsgD family transcriptional regulator
MGERLCWAAAAEIALAGGDAAAAWRVVEQLLAASTHLAEGISIPRLALLASRVLAAQKRFEEADRMLQAARTVAEREREMPILWRIHAAAGKVYQLQSQREQAKEASSRAQAVVAELAEAIPDATARREFLERAQALIPRVRPASTRQAEKKAYGGLTAREREVASMIAAGKSNREMAQALVVGERTVETHVSNILGKLGFASRAQIAAWAAARGLSAEEES